METASCNRSCNQQAAKHPGLGAPQPGTISLLFTSSGFRYMHMTSQVAIVLLSVLVLVLAWLSSQPAAAKKNIVTNASSVQIFRFWGTYLPGWQQFHAFWIYVHTYRSTWHQRWGAKCHSNLSSQSFVLHRMHTCLLQRDAYGHHQVKDLRIRAHGQTDQSWLKHTHQQRFLIPTDTAGLL
jgi:hypothetical protein